MKMTKEEDREYHRLKRLAFPEIHRASLRRYALKHLEERRAYDKKRWEENKESEIARHKAWRNANPEKVKAYEMEYKSRRPYYKRPRHIYCKNNWRGGRILNRNGSQFTYDDYDILFAFQNGRCAMCGRHQSDLRRTLCVDHNHQTKIARGLLCSGCNVRLGIFEAKDFMEKCSNYLDRYAPP